MIYDIDNKLYKNRSQVVHDENVLTHAIGDLVQKCEGGLWNMNRYQC